VILSFRDREAKKIFEDRPSRKYSGIQSVAHRKLTMLHAAKGLQDLAVLPGNRLEQLIGDRQGQHSIRINGQYRICFIWDGADASNVEIVDYH
jgi:toxin HigB-1